MEMNWHWFMTVDCNGRWITTNGKAHLETTNANLLGCMCYLDESDGTVEIYAKFTAYVKNDGSIVMTIESEKEDVPSFNVSGDFFSSETDNGLASTIILTDGTTVIGFAKREK
ncbi:hypothetical protein [Undibacterium sp. Xuan67W]|uniref:hypothetical protein n=1 Tax=Undibacterium sp. Xuan67W TaxID=3413057 RepID=UPI003BEF9639